MFDSVLQDGYRSTLGAERFQPLSRSVDVIGLRGDEHPINLNYVAGIRHKGRGDVHEAIRRVDREF
jgi:hypothetical protein